jgi:hypothetical protein
MGYNDFKYKKYKKLYNILKAGMYSFTNEKLLDQTELTNKNGIAVELNNGELFYNGKVYILKPTQPPKYKLKITNLDGSYFVIESVTNIIRNLKEKIKEKTGHNTFSIFINENEITGNTITLNEPETNITLIVLDTINVIEIQTIQNDWVKGDTRWYYGVFSRGKTKFDSNDAKFIIKFSNGEDITASGKIIVIDYGESSKIKWSLDSTPNIEQINGVIYYLSNSLRAIERGESPNIALTELLKYFRELERDYNVNHLL